MYSPQWFRSMTSLAENFQFFSGSSSRSRLRFFCSFFDTFRKNFMMTIPFLSRYRSYARMSSKRSRQILPAELASGKIWRERFEDIRAYERYLDRNGIVIMKFFLNVSKKEQKKRFLERLDEPEKNWKFSASDVMERNHWGEYMDAYEEMIQNTSTERVPWYVVPADHKWFTRVVVAEALVHALDKLNLSYPQVDKKKRSDLKKAPAVLMREK